MAEALLEKLEIESSEAQEQGLSPEMRERFKFLIKEGAGHYWMFDRLGNWSKFYHGWEGDGLAFKKIFLEARKIWVQMKEGDKEFEEFLKDMIREDLVSKKGHEVYRYFQIYQSLYGVGDYKFLSEILDHRAVWTDQDGSLMHNILEAMGGSKSQDCVATIIKYIDHVLSLEYKRKSHMDSDLDNAISVIINIIGADKTCDILDSLAEGDNTLKGWLEKNKIKTKIKNGSIKFYSFHDHTVEEFDPAIENERLATLQTELEEFEKNPPPPKKHKISPDMFGSSFDRLDRDEKDEDGWVLPPTTWPKAKEQISNAGSLLDENAERWEHGRLLNFYGRFRPQIEKPVAITAGNYLDGMVAIINNSVNPIDPDSYLNILSGVIDEKSTRKEDEELPTITEVEDIYRVAAIAFARGLSVGILENRIDDAITEINQAKDFIGSCAEKFDNPTQISFLLSLADQLGQLQVYLSELRDTKVLLEMPESANFFLITHPSIKRVREVADFRELLAEKIRWYIANDLSQNSQTIELKIENGGTEEEKIVPKSGPSFGRLKNIVSEYKKGLELYRNVEQADVPIYWEAKESLVKDFDSKRNVVFGRDGRYFFTALKASEFGQRRAEQKYVIITSLMHGDKDRSKLAADYLKQNGVTLDFNFIDTGYHGSIPEFAIRALADADNTHLDKDEVNNKIKLLSSSHPGRAQLSRRSRNTAMGLASDFVATIENRPKTIERPENLVMDDNGKVYPDIKPHSVKEQLRAWVVEHVSFRNFAPKLDYDHLPIELKISPQILEKLRQKGLIPEQAAEKTVDEVILDIEEEARKNSESTEQWMDKVGQTTSRKSKLSSFIEKHLDDISEDKKAEILKDSIRLYEVSRDKVAPVVVDFARWCLERAKPGQKVLFLARDGLAPWIAARLLVRQGKFPGITEDQLKYAHLSRNITWQEDEATLKQYLSQLGVEDDDQDLLTVDVGMFGAIHRSLQELYPQKKVSSLYLISASRDEGIEGYLSDVKKGTSSIDPIWKSIPGNPAVHFIEDTFAGFYGSTKGLEKSEDGTVKPHIGVPYSRDVYLKRLAAIDGIVDHALSQESRDPKENSAALNAYLASQFKKDKKYIMVPHE